MIEICAVGGYSEFGRNMTALRVDDEVIIIDMGLHMDNFIRVQGDEDPHNMNNIRLKKANAIPDYTLLKHWKHMVKAIIPTHAHLDHVGAVPFISNKFDAKIICTPFTAEVLKAIISDDKRNLKNPIKVIHPNSSYKISDNIETEFINITHSTPQTPLLAIHTPYGTIVYSNDFKLDSSPMLGSKPNFERIQSLDNVIALITDCTRAWDARKTPSEAVAKEMLRDVMMSTDSDGKAIIVTTFSSHLARLKSIIEFGKAKNRKIVFLGRSLAKYVEAGRKAGIVNFKEVDIVKYRQAIQKKLKRISKRAEDYLIVVTGHQGEPQSVLSRMAKGEFHFDFKYEDQVIFSCTIIPNEINIANRERLEEKLKEKGVRIFRDIHVSGHAAREDLRDLVNMVKPKHIIPAHGDRDMMDAMKELALEMRYSEDEIHMLENGDFLKI
ncbi:MAG: RNase J family beta-CASP ribonuclease [Candidatus Woesearchaeota archaeon]